MRCVESSGRGKLESGGDKEVVVCGGGGGGVLGVEGRGVAFVREAGGFEKGFARGLGGFLEGRWEPVESAKAEDAA